MTKAELYKNTDCIREYLNIRRRDYPLNISSLCEQQKIKVETIPFKTKGLRGMAFIGETMEEDIIFLNRHRGEKELNFDCGHELMHLIYHRNKRNSFNCYESVLLQQDKYIEWQANESAAELLVPYKIFLPLVKSTYKYFDDFMNIMAFKRKTAQLFGVSESVISHRLDNLKYEIYQYLNNVPLDEVIIMSNSQQQSNNIVVESINDIENRLLNIDFERWFSTSAISS